MANLQLLAGCIGVALARTQPAIPAQIDAATPSRVVTGLAQSYVWPLPGPGILSQQSCNTQCQERQTDCALRCDQDAACIRRCRAEAEDCTARCIRAPATPPAERPTPAADGLPKLALETVWVINWS
jgi:hypothetical protein